MARLTTTTLPFALFTILFLILLACPVSAAANATNGTYTKPPITPSPTSTSSTKPTQSNVTAGAALSYPEVGSSVFGIVVIVAAGVVGLAFGL